MQGWSDPPLPLPPSDPYAPSRPHLTLAFHDPSHLQNPMQQLEVI
jgi:hypothetical protein